VGVGRGGGRARRSPEGLDAELLAGLRAMGEASDERALAGHLLDAALRAAGADGGEVLLADDGDGIPAAARGTRPPDGEIVRGLTAGGRNLGRLRVWGGTPGPSGLAALELLTVHGAQALAAARHERLERERAEREGRLEAVEAGQIGAPGSTAEALVAVTVAAGTLLDAPAAAVLIGDGGAVRAVAVQGAEGGPGAEDLAGLVTGSTLAAVERGTPWAGRVAPAGPRAEGLTHAALAALRWRGEGYGVLCALGDAAVARPGAVALLEGWARRAAPVLGATRLREEVRELSTVDPLTRLNNDRYFAERLEQEVNRAVRQRRPLSLMVLGLDGLAEVRARGEGRAADRRLLALAEHLARHRRTMDVACRLPGDEVAVILPDAQGLAAFLVAERLRSSLAAADGAERRTLSIGVASFPDQSSSGEALAADAARALAWARRHGGDRAFLYDREVAESLEAEERERRATDEAFLTTVYALAAAVDARDPTTRHHSRSVARVAALLARQLGLSAPRAEEVRLAGLLHDVGKIGVSDHVLRKPGPLSDEEWVEMREHPAIGHRILSGTRLEVIRPWVLHHHERVDGAGYPHGLIGTEIPFESRIIAVADALDTMLGDRPYRAALEPQDAMAELDRCSGTQFDAAVVEALRKLIERGVPGVVPRRA
jgi:diguanylate cyclase (GGDEF)-like protein/putative nucleotidyltransferase with HDIG domain